MPAGLDAATVISRSADLGSGLAFGETFAPLVTYLFHDFQECTIFGCDSKLV